MSKKKRLQLAAEQAPMRYGYKSGPFSAKDATISIWTDGRWVQVPATVKGPTK